MKPRFTLLAFLIVFAGSGSFLRATPPADQTPIVILISIDGCRWDYVPKFAPPNLTKLAATGVEAERMLSCFPSSTFPNHYSIATGLRPEHHGIISNRMYDPTFNTFFSLHNNPGPREGRWWGGEPIWVTATKQGLRSACMYWPGSEAVIAGHRPDLWRPYNGKVTCSERARVVLDWLQLPATERPQFITLYFDVVDTAGHTYGPATPEVRDALLDVDQALGELIDGVHRLGLDAQVNYIVTADHGMTQISTSRRIALDDYVDPETVQIDFSGAVGGLRPLTGTIDELYAKFAEKHPHFQVYRREDVPDRLHFSDNLRIPPVVIIPDLGWTFGTKAGFARDDASDYGNGGAHGYDPELPDMGATFIASGPAIRSGAIIPPFENILVYDLLCSLLKIQPAPNDGDHRLSFRVMHD